VLTFIAAVTLLIGTPGPGVLSAAGFGAAYGFKPSLRYVLGLFFGTNLVLLSIISGFAAIIMSMPQLRLVLMVLSVSYLLYLAARIAFAGSKIAFISAKTSPGIWSGILLQVINPKAYAVNTSLITGFNYAPDNVVFEIASKVVIIMLIWTPIHLGWLWAGVVLHRLDLPAKTQRRINIVMASAMLGVVGLAVFSAVRASL
jgi:threonine/homoserine/homoserine lactone efflux protein